VWKRRENRMSRVDVIMDIDQTYLMDAPNKKYEKTIKDHTGKTIKIKDKIFEFALQEGLIEKTDDGYVFVGTYEDLAKFKKKKH
jgi:hypothetical protein